MAWFVEEFVITKGSDVRAAARGSRATNNCSILAMPAPTVPLQLADLFMMIGSQCFHFQDLLHPNLDVIVDLFDITLNIVDSLFQMLVSLFQIGHAIHKVFPIGKIGGDIVISIVFGTFRCGMTFGILLIISIVFGTGILLGIPAVVSSIWKDSSSD